MNVHDEDSLRAAVESRFVATGADTPGWPDPHEGREPADDEYSRCSDPERYEILRARMRAWIDVLVEQGLARVEDLGEADLPAGDLTGRFEAAMHLIPEREGARSLLVVYRHVDGLFVELGVARRSGHWRRLDSIPFCGCDACDDGSDFYLEEVDDAVLGVVAGRASGRRALPWW